MNLDATIQSLRQEIDRIRLDAEARMAVLQGAIDLLQTSAPDRPATSSPVALAPTAPASPAHRNGPTVVETLKEIIAGFPTATVFDAKHLKNSCATRFPDRFAKVKTGIWPALQQLVDKGVIERHPGGYRLVPGTVPNLATT